MERNDLQKSTGISGIIYIRVSIQKGLVLSHMENHKTSLKWILVFSSIFLNFGTFFINNLNIDIQPVIFY